MERREFLRLATAAAFAAAATPGLRQVCRAGQTPSVVQVTRGSARLKIPASTPAGQTWRYCIPFPFQLAPRKAAMICNIRGNHPGDFEVGTDFIPFESLARFEAGTAIPISRIERGVNPNSQPAPEPCWLIKQWVRIGFIPLGAKRSDGSAHPHAGTGFGVNEVIAWPLRDKHAAEGADDRPSDPYGGHEHYGYHELHQFSYDGNQFRVLESRSLAYNELLPGWDLWSGGMTSALPQGDNLVIPFVGGRKDVAGGPGILRWVCQDGKWRPARFVPARLGDTGEGSFEPSLVRDTDGAWLLSARGVGDNAMSIRVWRSKDRGTHWKALLSLPEVLPKCPVALHQASDGTFFIAANLSSADIPTRVAPQFPLPLDAAGHPRKGRIREVLCLWPLDVKNARLMPPCVVRDGRADFGPPPSGITWTIDHPIVTNLQLSDGRWHTVLGYRVVDRGETVRASMPPPQTGAYLEEVSCAGAPIPAWRF